MTVFLLFANSSYATDELVSVASLMDSMMQMECDMQAMGNSCDTHNNSHADCASHTFCNSPIYAFNEVNIGYPRRSASNLYLSLPIDYLSVISPHAHKPPIFS